MRPDDPARGVLVPQALLLGAQLVREQDVDQGVGGADVVLPLVRLPLERA